MLTADVGTILRKWFRGYKYCYLGRLGCGICYHSGSPAPVLRPNFVWQLQKSFFAVCWLRFSLPTGRQDVAPDAGAAPKLQAALRNREIPLGARRDLPLQAATQALSATRRMSCFRR